MICIGTQEEEMLYRDGPVRSKFHERYSIRKQGTIAEIRRNSNIQKVAAYNIPRNSIDANVIEISQVIQGFDRIFVNGALAFAAQNAFLYFSGTRNYHKQKLALG